MRSSNEKPVIVTVTINPAIDKLTTVTEMVSEKKLRCSAPIIDPGGGGINVARVINRLGGRACAIYLGGGYNGALIKKLLDKEAIQNIQSPIVNDTRENIVVFETCSNRQYRFVMPGPEVTGKECDTLLAAVNKLTNIDFLVVSGSLSPGVSPSILTMFGEIAKHKHAKYIVDTSGNALKAALDTDIYLLKPNLDELASIKGSGKLTQTDAISVAREIIAQRKCEIIVISMGKAGAVLVSANDVFQATSPEVEVKSTVGAGDSMLGGMIWALSNKLDLQRVLHYGIASGTAATMNEGSELCHKKDVHILFSELQLLAKEFKNI